MSGTENGYGATRVVGESGYESARAGKFSTPLCDVRYLPMRCATRIVLCDVQCGALSSRMVLRQLPYGEGAQ
eukprot:3711381-Rhodomonas_salina.1